MTKISDVAELQRRVAEMQAALAVARGYVAAAVLRAPRPTANGRPLTSPRSTRHRGKWDRRPARPVATWSGAVTRETGWRPSPLRGS